MGAKSQINEVVVRSVALVRLDGFFQRSDGWVVRITENGRSTDTEVYFREEDARHYMAGVM